MQIPPTSSAAQAASILSQSTAKDGSASAASTPQSSAAHVEKSNSSSADRDAQGQGDGFSDAAPKPQEDVIDLAGEGEVNSQRTAPQLPGEPPSNLDIVG
ncbi:MAG: hypothetical protein R3C53_14600 [Pirellulaceae bacterium]